MDRDTKQEVPPASQPNRDSEQDAEREERDRLQEEEDEESFPASDPPSSNVFE